MNANDVLGDYDNRYFGAGHKKTNYNVTSITHDVKKKVYKAIAKVDISKTSWSIKKGHVMKAHLSTIDAIILSGLFAEKALLKERANKFYIQSFNFHAGRKAVEALDKIPMTLTVISVTKLHIDCQINIEDMKVKLLLKLSNKENKQYIKESSYYISNHLNNDILKINDIKYLDKSGLATKVDREKIRINLIAD